jgi:hypothetical protein
MTHADLNAPSADNPFWPSRVETQNAMDLALRDHNRETANTRKRKLGAMQGVYLGLSTIIANHRNRPVIVRGELQLVDRSS